jgi:hypothetical protein
VTPPTVSKSNIEALTIGRLGDIRLYRRCLVVDWRGSILFGDEFLVGRHCSKNLCTECPSDLYGNVTDTAGPGMDQNFLARMHASTIHQSLPGRSAETSALDIHGAFRRAAASDLTCRPKLEFCQCSMH